MFSTLMHGETITVTRWLRDDRNAHGQLHPVYADPEDIAGVGVDIPNADEPRDGTTNRLIVDLRLFLPPGMTISAKDKITVRGDAYEVEGTAPPVQNFFTGTAYRTEVNLRRTTG